MSEPIMNLLQSFMGCMYPGSIRTDSIESLNNDYSEYRYEVENIDERCKTVSRGELHVTDSDLIYFKPGKFPTRWPVDYIRRFGCSEQGNIFSFEAGRRCQTGPAIFAFRLDEANDLVNRLMENINKRKSNSQNGTMNQYLGNRNSVAISSPNRSFNFSSRKTSQCDKKDAATAIDNSIVNPASVDDTAECYDADRLDPRPLSYALIDFKTTEALSETFQAHANRTRI